jgi:hypothetical protein
VSRTPPGRPLRGNRPLNPIDVMIAQGVRGAGVCAGLERFHNCRARKRQPSEAFSPPRRNLRPVCRKLSSTGAQFQWVVQMGMKVKLWSGADLPGSARSVPTPSYLSHPPISCETVKLWTSSHLLACRGVCPGKAILVMPQKEKTVTGRKILPVLTGRS